MLREIEPNQLWCIEEPMPLLGLSLGARLTIACLRSGELWVYAPFAISDEDADAIRAQGQVAHIVAPNSFHFTQIGDFARRFPDAQLWVVPALATKLDDVPHLPLHALPPSWDGDFDGLLFDAALGYQEWAFCHRATRTLLVTDLILNVPRPDNPLGRVMGALLDEGRGAKTSRLVRAAIYGGRDLPRARQAVHQIGRWDFGRIVMAHGSLVPRAGQHVWRRAFRWL